MASSTSTSGVIARLPLGPCADPGAPTGSLPEGPPTVVPVVSTPPDLFRYAVYPGH